MKSHLAHGLTLFTASQVFLHNEQIFRLLLKISVEKNNGMSLKTNFSSPCLEAGPTISYKSFHTVDTRFSEQTPRYSDYYGQFA